MNKIIDLILNIIFRKKLKKKTKTLKTDFKVFHIDEFGDYYVPDPILYHYHIYKFYCSYENREIILNIKLRNPGLLIGKGGYIDSIKKYLNIKINIIEFDIFS